MSPPAYSKLALDLIATWQASLEANLIAHPRDVAPGPPSADAGGDDLNAIARPADPFGEPFASGTFVGKLESSDAGEEGLYSIVLLRHPRTPYSFALATKDPHPSSEPARAPFYVHAHRLLAAVEDALSPSGERGIAEFSKGVDAGDADGERKRFTFFFYAAEQQPSPSSAIPPSTFPLPPPSSLTADLPALLERALPPADEPYNAVLTLDELHVFPREKGRRGLLDGDRVDGGALYQF